MWWLEGGEEWGGEREEVRAYDVCGGGERGAVCAGVLEGLRLG